MVVLVEVGEDNEAIAVGGWIDKVRVKRSRVDSGVIVAVVFENVDFVVVGSDEVSVGGIPLRIVGVNGGVMGFEGVHSLERGKVFLELIENGFLIGSGCSIIFLVVGDWIEEFLSSKAGLDI